MSSTHTLPVNIFNLEGGEIMLARDNENFRTRARIELTTLRILQVYRTFQPLNRDGREFDSCPGHGNFLCPGRAWFLLLPS